MKDLPFIHHLRVLATRCTEPENMRHLMHIVWGGALSLCAALVVIMWGVAASITLTVFDDLTAIAMQTVAPVHVSFDGAQLEDMRLQVSALHSATSTGFVPFHDPSQ